MTAIEEMGKTRTLQMVQSDIYPEREPSKINEQGLNQFLNEHSDKALRAAASALSVNHGAARRHGRHEEADLNLSSGILFLTKSDNWMDLRNSCLYADVSFHQKSIEWPMGEISAHHAYYFVCMALEILAEEAEAGFGSPIENLETESSVIEFDTGANFRSGMISILKQFMAKYEEDFNPAELAFFLQNIHSTMVREKKFESAKLVQIKNVEKIYETTYQNRSSNQKMLRLTIYRRILTMRSTKTQL